MPSDECAGTQNAWCHAYANVPERNDVIDLTRLLDRRQADSRAAWMRWHPTGIEDMFNASERHWYLALERARVEVLASRDLPGVALNLWRPPPSRVTQSIIGAFYLVSREILGGDDDARLFLPVADDEPSNAGRPSVWSRVLNLIGMRPNAEPMSARGAVPAVLENSTRLSIVRARLQLADGRGFALEVRSCVQLLAARFGDCMAEGDRLTYAVSTDESSGADFLEAPAAVTEISQVPGASDRDVFKAPYRVFDSSLDLECSAARLFIMADAVALNILSGRRRDRVRQLAHRLQRRIEAHRQRRWSFDQEQGSLDSRRLARLVASQSDRRVFRFEDDSQRPEATVVLLVDQSGSMRGERRELTAMSIDFAVHLLEVCRIECEVLGYTTRFGADSPSARTWRDRGGPNRPGRLNSIQHIVYKSVEQPWVRVRRNLGVLLRPELAKENIDGEALLWAARRLSGRRQPRQVLIVLSDGAPFDADTVAANGRMYLEQHLRQSITAVERAGIMLTAIGAGSEVGRYYKNAVTLRDPSKIAETLFACLGDALCINQETELLQ
jgi:cobaltochelatase CobT